MFRNWKYKINLRVQPTNVLVKITINRLIWPCFYGKLVIILAEYLRLLNLKSFTYLYLCRINPFKHKNCVSLRPRGKGVTLINLLQLAFMATQSKVNQTSAMQKKYFNQKYLSHKNDFNVLFFSKVKNKAIIFAAV